MIERFEAAQAEIKKDISTIAKNGTAFIENTHGLHRGYPPSNKTRLMFAICWCIGMEYFNNSPDYVLKSQEALNSLKN